jgi:prepilin-type N-terminal cleavage/methylation domain-containing protein
MNKVSESKKGFTIIEVVVVLAIAGLIFGIVFWALPNLQKSNRDSTRKTITANVLANLDQYASNSNGTYPPFDDFDDFLDDFFPEGIEDPLAGTFTLVSGDTDQDVTDNVVGSLIYGRNDSSGYKCTAGSPGEIEAGVGSRAVAVAIKVEQGAGYCLDNS